MGLRVTESTLKLFGQSVSRLRQCSHVRLNLFKVFAHSGKSRSNVLHTVKTKCWLQVHGSFVR